MGASATQDEDIIIFNDESESEQLEIVNGQAPKVEKAVSETVETEDLISFEIEDEWTANLPTEEQTTENLLVEETSVEDSLIDLVSEETVDDILTETPSIEEQLKSLEIAGEETLTEAVEEKTEEISLEINEETPVISAADEDVKAEEIEEISFEIEAEEDTKTSNEDLKAQLIEAQDKADGISFEDMGIDLDKLGDSKWENLENIQIEAQAEPKNSLEAETAVFWGVALLWLEDNAKTEEVEEIDMSNLNDDIWAFGDLSDEMQGVDEGTHDGILESAILKLVNRDKGIDWEIEKEEKAKSEKKDEIAELKKQIKELQWEVSEIENEIKDLETEKATTNKTKEGLEKMKIAA